MHASEAAANAILTMDGARTFLTPAEEAVNFIVLAVFYGVVVGIPVFAFVAAVLAVAGIAHLIFYPPPEPQRWYWLAAILLVPVLGTILYFALGRAPPRPGYRR